MFPVSIFIRDCLNHHVHEVVIYLYLLARAQQYNFYICLFLSMLSAQCLWIKT